MTRSNKLNRAPTLSGHVLWRGKGWNTFEPQRLMGSRKCRGALRLHTLSATAALKTAHSGSPWSFRKGLLCALTWLKPGERPSPPFHSP